MRAALSASLEAAQLGLPEGRAVSATDLWTGSASLTAAGEPLALTLNATDGFAMLRLRPAHY